MRASGPPPVFTSLISTESYSSENITFSRRNTLKKDVEIKKAVRFGTKTDSDCLKLYTLVTCVLISRRSWSVK